MIVRSMRNGRWGAWAAGFAAYLVAFQLVFAGVAPAGHAAPGGRTIDAGLAGQPICGHALQAQDAPDGPGPHDAPKPCPECCLLGCTLGALFVAPAAAELPPSRVSARFVVLGRTLDAPDLRRQYSPRTTRGPPGIA